MCSFQSALCRKWTGLQGQVHEEEARNNRDIVLHVTIVFENNTMLKSVQIDLFMIDKDNGVLSNAHKPRKDQQQRMKR